MVAALPHLVPLSEAALGDLAGRVRRRRFATGEILARQGDTAAEFCVLRRGRCTVLTTDRGGRESVIRRLHPSEAFGDLALREGTVQPATTRAESAGALFVIDAGTYRRLLAGVLAPSPEPDQWPTARVRALPPFRDLDRAAATALAAVGRWVDLPPGQPVAAGAGDPCVYVVATGQLEVLRAGRRVGVLRTGYCFGADAVSRAGLPDAAHRAPGVATLRTLTRVRLFSAPREVVDQLPRIPLELRPGDGQRQDPAPETPRGDQR
jgi:CRP-like cAMP-binding protein